METQTAMKTELVITRVFNAPPSVVWQAWTEPERVKQWWGPKGYTLPRCSIDLRVGGKSFYCMRGPDGKEVCSVGTYQRVDPLECIDVTDSFADAQGNVVPATYYGMSAEMPREMEIVVTFEEKSGSTLMTLRHIGMPAGDMLRQAGEGWEESFDKLELYLSDRRGEIL